MKNVSIHVPTRGTTDKTARASIQSIQFQSTFPRGERHGNGYKKPFIKPVSIHVPTRGTTLNPTRQRLRTVVSIHVPTRGTTEYAFCDVRGLEVSIHVPTRGTTGKINGFKRFNDCFNPRSHEGNDSLLFISLSLQVVFQSTFPRGERLRGSAAHLLFDKFQSTFPRGERPNANISDTFYPTVSIHVPTRGTTGISSIRISQKFCFNPRSHEGNDVPMQPDHKN